MSARPRLRQNPAALSGALAAVSLVVSAAFMGMPSFWFDEAASISAATRSWSSLWQLLGQIDAVHGLYYAFLKVWVSLAGTSEVMLRLPSALALCAATFLFTRLAFRLGGRRFALVSGLIFLLLPGIVWSGDEAREYAFTLLATVVATREVTLWALGERRTLAGYTAAMVVSAYLSFLSLLLLPVHLLLVVAWRRGGAPRVVIHHAGVVLVTVPLLLLAFRERGQLDYIDLTPARLLAKVVVGQFFLGPRNTTGISVAMVCGTVLAALFAVCLIVCLRVRRLDRIVLLGLLWCALPTIVLVAVALTGVKIYQERYLIFAAPGVALLMAFALTSLAWRSAAIVATAVVVALCLPIIWSQKGEASKSGDDYRALAQSAQDSRTVFFDPESARGVAIAYPAAFRNAADVLLAQSSAVSGTLWGINKPVGADRVAAITGRVTVITYAEGPRTIEEAEFALRCRPAGTVIRTRWRSTSWQC